MASALAARETGVSSLLADGSRGRGIQWRKILGRGIQWRRRTTTRASWGRRDRRAGGRRRCVPDPHGGGVVGLSATMRWQRASTDERVRGVEDEQIGWGLGRWAPEDEEEAVEKTRDGERAWASGTAGEGGRAAAAGKEKGKAGGWWDHGGWV
ncbi:hypothetical protein BS78_03G146700 [Paspalum vaginatum]|nr:hypothetical protein BS78_03G146700 [Paspalum vaginatum]